LREALGDDPAGVSAVADRVAWVQWRAARIRGSHTRPPRPSPAPERKALRKSSIPTT